MAAVIESVDPCDYLRGELTRDGRREFVNGRAYALSGGTMTHAELTANIFGAAFSASRKTGCKVLSQCMLVHIADLNSFYYPDVVATCERQDAGNNQTLTAPCFIVEVLSRSTASIDRREKRLAYTSLPSLQEYVLVYQDRMRVDLFQRNGKRWDVTILHQPQNVVPVTCLRDAITLQEIYRGVTLPLSVGDELDDDEWGMEMLAQRALENRLAGREGPPATWPFKG